MEQEQLSLALPVKTSKSFANSLVGDRMLNQNVFAERSWKAVALSSDLSDKGTKEAMR